MSRITFWLMALVAIAAIAHPAKADYDINTLGVPKFVNSLYIDMRKITRLSKFRSYVGHEYSDNSQFGAGGVRGAGNRVEQCRSMKHYFIAPDNTVNIYAPVTGTVTNVTDEFLGQQIEFRSDAYPDFRFIIFHVGLSPRLNIGDHVDEGQLLGTHGGSATWSDMAVWVQTPAGKHLISYFETLTDTAFATLQARGVTTRDELIITQAQRDANGFSCPGFSNPAASEFVNLTGGAATQTISLQTQLPFYRNVGDAPINIGATASSGLPVTYTLQTPKVCTVFEGAVSARRVGVCKITLNQAGDANTFAANPMKLVSYVLPRGEIEPPRARVAGIYPPADTGPQSYLRFYNISGVANTVTGSLFNAATGELRAKWTSPAIPAQASIQVDIATLEAVAVSGTARAASYTLRIDPESAMFGYMQHVVFDRAAQVLTNQSSCGAATTAPVNQVMNVHSSRLSTSYPSTIVYNHLGSGTGAMALDIADANTGSRIGYHFSTSLATNTAQIYTVDAIESQITLQGTTTKTPYTPTAAQFHYNFYDAALQINATTQRDFYQNVVTNKQSGLVADMTPMCLVFGLSPTTIPTTLRSSLVYSGSHPTLQSYLRFYNGGVTAGPVSVTFYDTKTGQAYGPWESPTIPVNAELQFPVGGIEAALGLSGHESYTVDVQTGIDGLFQHVLWRAPDGALSNASTCSESVGADPYTLVGVHSALMTAAGYPSSILIHNTGSATATANLTIYAAYDGTAIGTYAARDIPANGARSIDVSTIEASAGMVPGGHMFHYVVKADPSFTGSLQHLLKNNRAGVTTDMTGVCMM